MGRRDDLTQLLGEFLSRIRESGDPSQAMAPTVVAVAADLARSLDETNGGDVHARYLLGWLSWHQAEVAPARQRQALVDNALELMAPAATMIGQVEFPAPLLPALTDRAMPDLTDMVEHARATQDLALLSDVIVRYDHVLNATPEAHPEFARRLSIFGVALSLLSQWRGEARYMDDALAVSRRAVLLGADDGDIDMYLLNLCALLKSRHESTGDPADLEEAVDVGRRAVAATTGADRLPSVLTNLSAVLLARFALTSSPADLAEATDAARRAVATAHPADPHRPAMLNNLARALHDSYLRGDPSANLDEAIDIGRLAAQTGDGQPDAQMFLSNLEEMLGRRFELSNRAADLDEAIVTGRRLVSITRRASHLVRLAANLATRVASTRDPADLDEATAVARQAVATADHGSRLIALDLLDQVLSARFGLSGAFGEQDEVINTRRAIVAAIPAGDPDRTRRLSGLAFALLDRFERRKEPQDLNEAVDTLRSAPAAATTDLDRLYCLSDLCGALFARYTDLHTRDDLAEAASIARDAAGTAVPEPPPGVLLNLAHVLDQHARVAAVLDDIDAAIGLVRRAAAAAGRTKQPPPADRQYIQLRASDIWDGRHEAAQVAVLRLLSAYLLRRYEWTNVLADVDDAIQARRQVVALTGGDDAEHADSLAALGYALKARFAKTGSDPDLDEALAAGRHALAHDAGKAIYLVSLSDTLKLRFVRRGDESDLDEAVELGRRATELMPADSPRRSDAFTNLSELLRTRFNRHPYVNDINEAVDAARTAVLAGEDDDFDRPKRLFTLARALVARIRYAARHRDTRGEIDLEADRSEALRVLTDMVGRATAAPRVRVECAQMGAWLAVEDRAPGSEDFVLAADLLETAVHLVPEVAPRRMRHLEQRDAIKSATGLADDAAALALVAQDRPADERAERALSLLEAGRAVLLSQLLGTRGFATFARLPTAAELRAAAGQGPVVTFNVAYSGSALLLTENGITALPLPGLTAPAVIDQVNAFHVALREAYDPAADRVAAQGVLADVLTWLWDNVTGPVLDELGYRGTPEDGETWPRLWWAPGGYLSLLPLHAAGHHDDPVGGRTVLDRVVSSYTPTIRSLRHARHRQAATAGVPDRSLVVAMPATTGLADLRNVHTETELLTGVLPDPHILTEPDRAAVLAELPRHSIAHFACHGSYDIDNPANSRLLLADHERHPLTVGDLNAVNLDAARLAYLSACHTALNSADQLLDEAMHLAGALQAAGFPQVVGTLWELDDEVAVEITEDFYRGLRAPGTETLDLGRAARSLHQAVRAQRASYPGTPSLWASHMHFGA